LANNKITKALPSQDNLLDKEGKRNLQLNTLNSNSAKDGGQASTASTNLNKVSEKCFILDFNSF
jgi:hypothetical protein